ncbi:MAG: tripartite tricarboxylate transporter substrate binding protein [Rhodobacterales bacterium]|nr:tripartite tricarboxylate transporter substrate binding protein [Rhodobacterales bacterium]
MLKTFKRLIAALAVTMAASPVVAAFPEKPVTVVIPYQPGGGTDVMFRIFQTAIEEELGTTLVVEYAGGAATLVGTRKALAAPADGYTVLVTTSAIALNTIMVEGKPYTMDDFEVIGSMTEYPYALYVNDQQPFDDLEGFIAYAKANPGALNYLHLGQASPTRLLAARLAHETGTELTPVAYPGSGPGQPDFYANRVQMQMASASKQYYAGPNTKAIAVASNDRVALMPEVPTFKELGYPNMVGGTWFGMFAKAGIPVEARDKLRAALVAAEQKVLKELEAAGHYAVPVKPEDFRAYIDADLAHWKEDLIRLGEKIY